MSYSLLRPRTKLGFAFSLLSLGALSACSGDSGKSDGLYDQPSGGTDAGGNQGHGGSQNSTSGGFGGTIQGGNGSGGSANGGSISGGSGGQGPVCESTSQKAELEPIHLAFALDVSGSMGKLDRPFWWHDPTKKWEPIANALSAFFDDGSDANITASLALFPAKSNKCDASTYATPDVSKRPLGAPEFTASLNAYEDEVRVSGQLAGGNWRGDTPTLQVVQGTIQYIQSLAEADPTAKFAFVLVTDGLPQGCGNSAEAINQIVALVGPLKDTIPTYVIGIENPTTPPAAAPWGNGWGGSCGSPEGSAPCDAPDTLSELNAIAVAGGSGSATLIDTNNAGDAANTFRNKINEIRKSTTSCEFTIPDHPEGGTFDKNRINVRATNGSQSESFFYNPECKGTPAEQAKSWRYDNEANPTKIELCASTCTAIREASSDINVEFLCEDRSDDQIIK